MSANDASIRLKISTLLDAAGIKATQEQINKLSQSVSNANMKMGGEFGSVERAIGRLPGAFGRVGRAMGGLAGQAALLIGAFKMGWDIGSWLNEKVIDPLLDVKNPIDQLKKANGELARECQKAWDAESRRLARASDEYDNDIKRADAMIAKIKAEARAYEMAHKAKMGFLMAGEDVELQRLERERFEDVAYLRSIGNDDAADQADALYDYYRAELQAKKEIVKLDEADAAANAKRLEVEKRIAAERAKVERTNEKLMMLAKERADLENGEGRYAEGGAGYYSVNTAEKWQKRMDELTKAENRAVDSSRRAAIRLQEAENALIPLDVEDATRARNRASAVDAAYLARDRAALSFDNITARSGNALGISFDEKYVEQLNQSSIDSYNELASINERTATAADYLAEIAAAFRGGE